MAQLPPKRPGPGRPKDDDLAARRRADIVKHAIEEFARRGYGNADLDVIAANAGCSKGTLYNYFASKGELFNASVDHVMFCVKEEVGDPDGDPIDQLEWLMCGFLKSFADHPQYVELLVQERADFRDRVDPAYNQYRTATRKRWETRFEQLLADGRMRKMPTERALNVLGDLLYGTVFMNHIRGRRSNPEQQAAELLEIFLGGILTEAEFTSRQKAATPL